MVYLLDFQQIVKVQNSNHILELELMKKGIINKIKF